MFFICATTLAWGGWTIEFSEECQKQFLLLFLLLVLFAIIIMFIAIVFGNNHVIYHWADPEKVNLMSHALKHKSGFLNKAFFTVWTVLTISLWSLLE